MSRISKVFILSDGQFCEARQLERMVLLIQSLKRTPALFLPETAFHLVNRTLSGFVHKIDVNKKGGLTGKWYSNLLAGRTSDDLIHGIGLTVAESLVEDEALISEPVLLDLSGLALLSPNCHFGRTESLKTRLTFLFQVLQSRPDWTVLLPRSEWCDELIPLPRRLRIVRDDVIRSPEIKMEQVHGPPIVLMPSRLSALTGADLFVDVARQIRKLSIPARFVFSGRSDVDDPDHVPVSQIKSWEDEKAVEWWDRMPMHEAIATSHLIVFPTRGPLHYRALSEALALCKPIVANDVIGIESYVKENENGFIVDLGNSRTLAEAIIPFLLDPSRCEKMGQASSHVFSLLEEDVKRENYEMVLCSHYGQQSEAEYQ